MLSLVQFITMLLCLQKLHLVIPDKERPHQRQISQKAKTVPFDSLVMSGIIAAAFLENC
jgi:hypothetical protein